MTERTLSSSSSVAPGRARGASPTTAELARHGAVAPDPERALRSRANQSLAWFGHLIVYSLSCLLLFVVAGSFAAVVVAIAWGVGLASHGFFAVAAPRLRDRWMARARLGELPAEAVLRKRAASEADRARARSLEELSASIAHEIRNPITAAKSLVQQIAEDPSGTDAALHAKVAIEELDRVERSIAHLLRFAREEPFDPQEIDLAHVVNAAVDTMRDRAARENVRLVVDLAEIYGPALFEGDSEQLRRVIMNLIGNALDAHEGHAATKDAVVTVAAGENLAGTDVWVKVTDNGPGILPEAREKIFRPFFTSKKKGTGLGLALAKKIIERHGGSIEVESQSERGASFVVVLPRRSAASEEVRA